MRKELLVLGIALLFVGVVATSVAANIQEEKVVSIDWEKKPIRVWSVSGNFSKGRKLRVYIAPGKDWRGEPQGGMDIVNFSVTICDPQGGKTELRAIFSSDPFASEPKLQPHAVQLVSNDGGLIFQKANELETIGETVYYGEISGIVNYDGPYNVTVYRTFGIFGPPEVLGLESLWVEKEYPYWFVIVMGVGFMVAGVFLFMWAWKSPKHKKR